MLGFLRGMGVVPTPAPAVDMSPAGQLIAAYRRYLTDERGMGWSARDFYVRVARRFLDHHAPAAGLGLGEVTAADVATFVLAECARRSVRSGVLSATRSEEHTSELQSLMRISYAVFCLKKKKNV